MSNTPGDELAASLAAHAASGSRVEAGRLRAAIKRSQNNNRSEVRALPLGAAKKPAETKEPLFPKARSLTELLNEFKGIHAPVETATVAPMESVTSGSTVAPSSSSSSGVHQHPLTSPIITEFNQNLLSRYVAERIVHMLGLLQQIAPDNAPAKRVALDAKYVRRLLSEPYGGFTSCTNKVCVGFTMEGKFALMAYVPPESMEHYDLTGMVPAQQFPLCYLCTLSVLVTAVDLASAAKSGVRTVDAPFFHPINCPGGYVLEAMHRSVVLGASLATTHPIRRMNVAEYTLDTRQVFVPEDGAALTANGWATEWAKRTVRGYSEDASLMFGSNYVPAVVQLAAPVRIVGVGELPPCERLLADKFLLPETLVDVPFVNVENASINALSLPVPISHTLGGSLRHGNILRVPAGSAHVQQVVWSLCWSDMMEARARLIHVINQAGNDPGTVAERYKLLPVHHKHFTMRDPHAIQARYSFKLHMIFYLTLTRLNELERLLESGSDHPRQIGPAPVHGERDMVERAFCKPGVVQQLKAYKESMAPLLAFFMERMRLGTAIDDSIFLVTGERVVRWFELRPAPQPTYFTPTDLSSHPLDVAAITKATPGSVAAAGVNSLPSADREAAPMQIYPGAFDDFWEATAALHGVMKRDQAPCMVYWQPIAHQCVFQLTEQVGLLMDQVRGVDGGDDDADDEWTERLRLEMATSPDTTTIWRALVYRINLASWLVHMSTAKLVVLEQQLARIGEQADAWLPSQYACELAVRIATAHAKATKPLSLEPLVHQVMNNMPVVSAEALPMVDEQRRLISLVQALKQFMAAHVPLVCAAILKRATSDDEMRPLVADNHPTPYGAPGTVCDETMMCMANELDGIEFLHDTPDSSLYSWVMSGVVPTTARISDLVARHREAQEKSDEYEEWGRQILYAHLVGAYPHARNVAQFDVWVRAHMLLFSGTDEVRRAAINYYMDDCQSVNSETDQVESTERIFFLALREHFVRTLELVPGYHWLVLGTYLAYPQFADDVRRHAEHVRASIGNCSLYGANRVLLETYSKSSQSWPTYHRPPPSFPAFMAECCKGVDIERAIDACEQKRAVLGNSDLRPPTYVIRGIGAYVESNVLPHQVYESRWMSDVGLSPDGVALINKLYAEHKGRAVNVTSGQVKLGRLAAQNPIDYQTVSVFFSVMQAHIARRVVQLDPDTTAAQLAAVSARSATGMEHASQCVMSSVQCCNTMRTFVVQDGSAVQGTQPMRLNLDTNKSMCVPKRGKAYASSRSGERQTAGSQSVRDKMKAYYDLLDSPTRTEFDTEELKSRRALMREALRSHVQTLSKGRYTLECGTMEVMHWPALGYVTVHGDQTCTVCPRCGNKTAYSPCMFTSNMFACGHCERSMQEALERAHEDRCAMCLQTPKAVARAMRMDNSERRLAGREVHVELLDDTVVNEVVTYRRAWICGMCNTERWLVPAAEVFTLTELRWLRTNPESFKRQLSELRDPVDWELMRRDIARAKNDPSVQFPLVHSVQAIPKYRRIKRRLGTQRV